VHGLIAGIVAGILTFSSAALAEEAPGRPSPEAPFGWTGLYIGINGGYGWGRVSNHLKVSSTGGPSSSAKVTADVDGPLGGGQLGYNWRSQRWVYGLEADFQGGDEDGLITGCSQLRCATISYGLDWFATLRGRLGYLLEPRLLLYGTGGLAYGRISTDFRSVSVPTAAASFNDSAQVASNDATRAGWVVGGGLEVALDQNWMLRAEYLYADLGTIASKSSTSVASACATGPQCLDNLAESKRTFHADFAEQVFRVGLSYRFADVDTPLK
jgi:outer membrane immunogenic protein